MEVEDPTPAYPVQEIPTPPSPVPRALTSEAKRAIFLEPRVRRWWYMAILTSLMFGGFCGQRLWARHVETDLIQHGLTVNAKIVYAENKQNNQPISSSDKANLLIDFPTGPEEMNEVYLTNHGMTGIAGVTGGTIVLHVDPHDHSRWTDRDEPTPLLDSMLVGLLALPTVPLLIGLGIVQLQNVRKIWQNGSPALAVVHSRKQSTLAPMSYAIRCSMKDLRHARCVHGVCSANWKRAGKR